MAGTVKKLLGAGAIAVAAALLAALPIGTATAADRTYIVLDGSGSMWGQIEGEAKISIARRVLRDVLADTPAELELGLIAYGHREEGQCGDIEILVQPQPGSADSVADAADGVTPLGKTPLTDAVRLAAEELATGDDRSTVILITDGIETCDADPCALGRELAASGTNFTAHVVGFGLSADEGQQVACLAEETGGLYLPASDADALAEVLTETVEDIAETVVEPEPVEEEIEEEEPAPVLPEVKLVAKGPVEIGKVFTVRWDNIEPSNRDTIEVVDPGAGPEGDDVRIAYRRVVNGDLEAQTVDFPAPVRPGTYAVYYIYSETDDVVGQTEIEVIDAAVSLDAAATVEIGRPFDIAWVGPGANRDEIWLFDPNGGPDGERVTYTRLVNGDFDNQSVTLMAPAVPGFYEIQYYNGDSGEVLTTRQIEVLEAEVSLAAPESAPIGSPIEVSWIGPGANRDEIWLFDPNGGPDGERVTYTRLVNGDFDNQSVTLMAPARAGEYELQYWNGDNQVVLATLPITIEDAEVSLDAPETAPIASPIEVSWIGPGARRDEVFLFDPNGGPDGARVTYQRLVNGDYDNQTVMLMAPARPGEYELQYWNGDNSTILATRMITIEAAEVSLEAPETVAIGSPIEVSWVGPGARRDEVYLFDPNSGPDGTRVTYQRLVNGDFDNQTVTLMAPATPGAYELQYWNGDNSVILATRAITVEEAEVSLDAPDSAPIGTAIDVVWAGPGARRDEIQIFDPNAGPDGNVVSSQRLTNGDYASRRVEMVVPALPGDYELRYFNGDNRAVLHTQPLTVELMEVLLDAPEAVEVETRFEVIWTGPGARRDEVQIFDASTERVTAASRLVGGDYANRSVTIRAPDEPGDYKLRYFNTDSRVVLFERSLIVQ